MDGDSQDMYSFKNPGSLCEWTEVADEIHKATILQSY